MVISPAPKCIHEIDILSSLQNPSIGSLSYRVKAIVVGKAMCKSPKVHPLVETVYQNTLHPRGTGRLVPSSKT